ncbi:MAG: radical SAM protein [Candidatus Bathyarchaeota archaeon]|nr:radical SAM protein [Candidatus Bathyarchaeota archaeon]MDH5494260.1 radical SAM protein [Candidatus Bathyarchaeota archaeon]
MNFLRKAFKQSKIPIGRYTYRGVGDLAKMALQLRVEPSGQGLLVINANTVLYLNETATAHAYFLMQGMSAEEAVKNIRKIYRVKAETAREEHKKLIFSISTLAQTEEVCPVSYLDVKQVEPFTQPLSAPLRMDLALTFQCQNNCIHCYAGGPHKTSELTTQQWREVIKKLEQIGVFIATFTGGEPTLREDLPELLKYAQETGIVTGLITNGRRLQDKKYIESLENAGLDFIQITLESHKAVVHDKITGVKGSWKETVAGIKNAVNTQVYVTTNTTLNKHNAADFLDTIDFLKKLGVTVFGCNSLIYSGKAVEVSDEFALSIETLKELLPKIREKAGHIGMKFLWYTPTQYCRLDPVKLGLGVKSCTAALVNMCIAPNGDVYPCQSYFESLGNILRDDWQKIWKHPVALELRSRQYAEPKCKDCPQLHICGGGCPLEPQKDRYLCAEA